MVIVKTIYQYGVNTAFFDPQPACSTQLLFFRHGPTTANGPDGQLTADTSTNRANPDPDGNGDPSESTPTPIGPLTPKAQIGLAKRLTQTDLQPDGSTLLSFEFTLKNLGNVHLTKIALLTTWRRYFPTACTVPQRAWAARV